MPKTADLLPFFLLGTRKREMGTWLRPKWWLVHNLTYARILQKDAFAECVFTARRFSLIPGTPCLELFQAVKEQRDFQTVKNFCDR